MDLTQLYQSMATTVQIYRKAHRLSAEECAKELGISKTQLLNIERCKANPTIATLELIARNMGTDLFTLLGSSDADRLANAMFLMTLLEDGRRFSLSSLQQAANHLVAALIILSNDQKSWPEQEKET